MPTETIKINVPVLARVEGEGALELSIENKQITNLKLRIFEPPRYFEKFLEGRYYYDVPDTVARICGICPVAYQMSATHAIESIFNITTTPWIRSMRRVFYCGEWIQSHSLHIHLLAAPDFLGFNSVIDMSAKYGDEVRRGLKLQALGNDLIKLFGARSVHPVGVKIGGFHKAPNQKSVDALLERLSEAKQDAIDLIRWLDELELPDDEQDFVSVALHHDDEYPINEGRLISDDGLNIAISEFENHFKEEHVDHSTALYCLLNAKPYLVGPLARINLNSNQLPDEVKTLMQGLRSQFPSKNMFHSIIARAIEILFAIIEAEKNLLAYEITDHASITFEPKAGTGYGCTEAPRGFLWHRFGMDKQGRVKKSIIVPPTSQNQSRIEQDLENSLISFGLDKSKDAIQLHAEKVIRNYDPCISCATHFLDLKLIRDDYKQETADSNKQATTKPAVKSAIKSFTEFASVDLTKTVIIGIGSPQKGDDLGWIIIDRLLQNKNISLLKEKGLSLIKLDRPGLSLIESISPYDHVLIIDAINPESDTHTIKPSFICLDARQLISPTSQLSSHEVGLIETVTLLKSLQLLPKQLIVFGVSVVENEVIDEIIHLF